MKLDQYYTKSAVADQCLRKLSKDLPQVKDKIFIEPSAGNGSFYSLLPRRRRAGLDIAPNGKGIERGDFLKWYPPTSDRERYVVVGNPPFGHRSKLAVSFFNHAADIADIIGFIVPRQFQKYSIHSRLNGDFKLIRDYELGENSFYTPNGKDFLVRCVFQEWTRKETGHKNIRLLASPPISHPDFSMYQYNNTPQALKVFDENWDFAVPRQGFEDYSRRETEKRRCERNKQWILFKARTHKTLKRLWNFDFVSLSKKNTIIYGFGKADVVMEYKKKYALICPRWTQLIGASRHISERRLIR